MSTIYRKTEKGRLEIETRTHRLAPRLRHALILVDGRRSDEELAHLITQAPAETLASLAADGFIEIVAASPAPPAASPPAAGPPAAQPPATPALPAAGSMPFPALRREAIRALTEAVGPMGEALAIRMERATDAQTLRPLLDIARQVIQNTRGAGAGDAFAARFIG